MPVPVCMRVRIYVHICLCEFVCECYPFINPGEVIFTKRNTAWIVIRDRICECCKDASANNVDSASMVPKRYQPTEGTKSECYSLIRLCFKAKLIIEMKNNKQNKKKQQQQKSKQINKTPISSTNNIGITGDLVYLQPRCFSQSQTRFLRLVLLGALENGNTLENPSQKSRGWVKENNIKHKLKRYLEFIRDYEALAIWCQPSKPDSVMISCENWMTFRSV